MISLKLAVGLLIIAVFALAFSIKSLQHQINEINEHLLVIYRTIRILVKKSGVKNEQL